MGKEFIDDHQDRIIEMPSHIKLAKENNSGKWFRITDALKTAHAVKMIADTTQTLVYSKEEFEKRFGKTPTGLRKHIEKLGLKPRIINDNGKVYVFANKV